MASIVVITALSLAVGCGVLGNPNPCDRTVEMRNALEAATGRDCDLISDSDLANVSNLPQNARYRNQGGSISLQPLKRSDFAGLTKLRSLSGTTIGNSEWPSVLETLDDLEELNLRVGVFSGNVLLRSNAFRGLDSLEQLNITSNKGFLLFEPNVFNGLDNLRVLYTNTIWGNVEPNVFNDLDNLRVLQMAARLKNSEWASVFETLGDLNLKELNLGVYAPSGDVSLPSNVFSGLHSLEKLTITSYTEGRYLLFEPNVFNGLDNLRVLDMGVREFSYDNCGDSNFGCAGIACFQNHMQSDWLTLEMLEDLPMLDTLNVCTHRVAEYSPDVMNTLIERRVEPFAK